MVGKVGQCSIKAAESPAGTGVRHGPVHCRLLAEFLAG
jgi:hypothetical protein